MEIEALLRILAEQNREHATILTDPEGYVIWWSHAARRTFGYGEAEILGKNVSVLFTPEDVQAGIPEYEREGAEKSGAGEDDRWMVRADGSRFWAAGIMTPLREKSGTLLGFGKILRDRTDRKFHVESLRNEVAALQKADEQKNIFLSTLSHELRNPLAPLVNALQLIHIIAPENPALQYPIKLIERQVEFIRRLVDDLLDVTRIKSGKIQLKKDALDLRDVINRALESARPVIEQRRHQLSVAMLPVPITVEADRDRLQQVFVNLIGNAAKYTPESGRISVHANIQGTEAVVKIEDNGIGIPKDMQARIFELFTQVDAGLSQSQGGLGIGLSLVKQLVALHGGSVQVRSEGAGKGSEFTVRLPRGRTPSPP